MDNHLCDPDILFNPLENTGLLSLEAVSYKDGFVEVSLIIPEGLLRSFFHLIGTLEGFFKHVSYKTKLAKSKASFQSLDEVSKRNNLRDDFKNDVLSEFDRFFSEGLSVKEAVKATNKAMKEKGSPWACYDIILGVIREAGRLKASGSKKGVQNA